jgi:hypothetical protein
MKEWGEGRRVHSGRAEDVRRRELWWRRREEGSKEGKRRVVIWDGRVDMRVSDGRCRTVECVIGAMGATITLMSCAMLDFPPPFDDDKTLAEFHPSPHVHNM